MKKYNLTSNFVLSLLILLLFTQCSHKEKTESAAEPVFAGVADEAAKPVEEVSDASSGNGITSKNTYTTNTVASGFANASYAVANVADANTNVAVSTSATSTTSTPKESVLTTEQEKIDRKLLKEATLSWETSDISKTHQQILNSIKKYSAYASNDEANTDDTRVVNMLEIRVPANHFDDFINDISKDVNVFDEKKISVLDVTEEYIDVSARIKTKKELEQHYYDLLKRTKNVSEILEVEQQLNNVRNDIESAEGRLKYLNDRVSLGTISITFYETKSAPIGFFGEVGKSFVQGWKGVLYFILGILKIWPFVIIIGTIMFFVVRFNKKK